MPNSSRFGALKSLKEILSDYLTLLEGKYEERECRNLFVVAMHHIDNFERKHILLDVKTDNESRYYDCLAQLEKKIPIQYVFGLAEFDGLDLVVNSSVLIPRPETLELVLWIAEDFRNKAVSICDIGTGSGCIALALAQRLPEATVSACDKYQNALDVAIQNGEKLNIAIEFFLCDVLKETIAECDVYVSNPPYIPFSEKREMDKLVVDNEPHTALFVENSNPLIFYKRIIEIASKSQGLCYFEIHENLQNKLEVMLQTMNLQFEFKNDLQGKCRMLKVIL